MDAARRVYRYRTKFSFVCLFILRTQYDHCRFWITGRSTQLLKKSKPREGSGVTSPVFPARRPKKNVKVMLTWCSPCDASAAEKEKPTLSKTPAARLSRLMARPLPRTTPPPAAPSSGGLVSVAGLAPGTRSPPALAPPLAPQFATVAIPPATYRG